MSENSTPEPEVSKEEKLRRERDLLLTTFDPAEFGAARSPVFTEPAGDFSVKDELTDPRVDPVRPGEEPTA